MVWSAELERLAVMLWHGLAWQRAGPLLLLALLILLVLLPVMVLHLMVHHQRRLV
jgi:hypothetical protein